MYVQRNIEARSWNDSNSKVISVKYSECVFVAWGAQHAMRMRHTVICGNTSLYDIFPYYKRHDFRKKKVTQHKMRVWSFSTTLVWNISQSKKN
jgi:hypothetical protein